MITRHKYFEIVFEEKGDKAYAINTCAVEGITKGDFRQKNIINFSFELHNIIKPIKQTFLQVLR